MLLGEYFGLFLVIGCAQIVCANNASWPRAGPSWLNDDDDDENVVEPQPRQDAKSQPKISFTSPYVKNAFATFTCDEAVEMQMSPSLPRRERKAFKELKKSLEKIINLPVTEREVLRGIHYYNSQVLKREPRCRINWTMPEAGAALLRYKNEMEIERILLPRKLLMSDIFDSMPFKELKCSIETIFGYTFDDGNLYDRATKELRKRNCVHSSVKSTPKCGQQSTTGSLATSVTSSAQAVDSANVQISPVLSTPMMLIDWSHPEVASAFATYQIDLAIELPYSQIFDAATVQASTAFLKLKEAMERIYNCRLTDNFFFDLLMTYMFS